jgi:hypothetical protein
MPAIDHRRPDEGHVECLAGIELPYQIAGTGVVYHELMTGRALELRPEHVQRRLERRDAQALDFGGLYGVALRGQEHDPNPDFDS